MLQPICVYHPLAKYVASVRGPVRGLASFPADHVPVRFSCGRPTLALHLDLDFAWLVRWEPEADPLAPDASWKRGTPKPDPLTGLYKALDPVTGEISPLKIDDREIDNLKNSCGGGLQAHNYWDYKLQFVQPLSDTLKELANSNKLWH